MPAAPKAKGIESDGIPIIRNDVAEYHCDLRSPLRRLAVGFSGASLVRSKRRRLKMKQSTKAFAVLPITLEPQFPFDVLRVR